MPRRYADSRAVSRRQGAQQQGQRGDGRASKEKPVMFEAWTVRRTVDVTQWEESVVSGGEDASASAVLADFARPRVPGRRLCLVLFCLL